MCFNYVLIEYFANVNLKNDFHKQNSHFCNNSLQKYLQNIAPSHPSHHQNSGGKMCDFVQKLGEKMCDFVQKLAQGVRQSLPRPLL